jgi:hypothetical protein
MVAAFGTWGGWPALIAVGTIGAVVVAVALQLWLWWREKHRRPVLTLAFDEHKTADEKYSESDTLATFLRLAVANASGKDTARDVEILVLEVNEFGTTPVGSGGRSIWLANPALGWTHAFDSEVRYQLPRISIPSGATRYADVGRWLQLADTSFELSFVLRAPIKMIPRP